MSGDIIVQDVILVFALFFLFVGTPFGYFCAVVAEAKGYNKVTWFVSGFFFLVIPLIAIAGMPMKQTE